MSNLAYITNIQKFCTHDGPGIRTNVFFKGCALNCQWCANPEAIQGYPQLMFYANKCIGCGRCIPVCVHEAISMKDGKIVQDPAKCRNCGKCTEVCQSEAREIIGKLYSPEEIFDIVNQDKVFYEASGGGVTFSGGEPLLHPEFVAEVARKCKAEGYNTAVETCGKFFLGPALEIIDLIDYALFDIKIINDEKHIHYCGKSNWKVHENFEAFLDRTKVIPRVPIIPTINDTSEDIEQLCHFFEKYGDKITKVHILPYHNLGMGKYDALCQPYKLTDIKPPSPEHMQDIKKRLERSGFEVVIGG